MGKPVPLVCSAAEERRFVDSKHFPVAESPNPAHLSAR
jgi:hypothetical protein